MSLYSVGHLIRRRHPGFNDRPQAALGVNPQPHPSTRCVWIIVIRPRNELNRVINPPLGACTARLFFACLYNADDQLIESDYLRILFRKTEPNLDTV